MPRKYDHTASSYVRYRYGIDAAEGLRQFPETQPLAEPLQELNERLGEARLARMAAELAVAPHSARVRFGDFLCDTAIRSLSRDAEVADGGRRGPVFDGIFPSGLNAVVATSGAAQLDATVALERRFSESRVAGVEPLRTEWMPRLADARQKLEDAVAARKTGRRALADARAREEAVMEEHETAIDKLLGQVRAIFPRDVARQNVVFPPAPARGRADDEADDDAETDAPLPAAP
ncbi:MAG: hypothetical protein AABZ30_08675 [Myxococcota bacterium]